MRTDGIVRAARARAAAPGIAPGRRAKEAEHGEQVGHVDSAVRVGVVVGERLPRRSPEGAEEAEHIDNVYRSVSVAVGDAGAGGILRGGGRREGDRRDERQRDAGGLHRSGQRGWVAGQGQRVNHKNLL